MIRSQKVNIQWDIYEPLIDGLALVCLDCGDSMSIPMMGILMDAKASVSRLVNVHQQSQSQDPKIQRRNILLKYPSEGAIACRFDIEVCVHV